jgi:hypothetical protein
MPGDDRVMYTVFYSQVAGSLGWEQLLILYALVSRPKKEARTMQPRTSPDVTTNGERLLLLIATIPIAVLSLAALLIPQQFAHLAGAAGSDPYIYRLVGAAALGYAGSLAWALRDTSWVHIRLLVVALLGFSLCGTLGSLLQLGMGDIKGIVRLILILGLLVSALCAILLFHHRAVPRPESNITGWLIVFFIVATAVAVPFAVVPLFFPEAFAHAFRLGTADLLLYRVGGAELAGYVVLGILEVQSRSTTEIHSAAIMVLFFNTMAVLPSLLALCAGKRPPLLYIVIVISGAISVLTLVELTRLTGGRVFAEDDVYVLQLNPSQRELTE